jgi:Tfp pilus assembly ATPase PilU
MDLSLFNMHSCVHSAPQLLGMVIIRDEDDGRPLVSEVLPDGPARAKGIVEGELQSLSAVGIRVKNTDGLTIPYDWFKLRGVLKHQRWKDSLAMRLKTGVVAVAVVVVVVVVVD